MKSDKSISIPSRRTTVAAFAIVYVVWSSTYLAIRIGVSDVPPLAFAGARFVLAGGLLAVIAWVRGASVARSDLLPSVVSGVLLFTGGNGLVTWAEKTMPSNVAAVMIALVPAFVACFEWLRPGGRAPRALVVLGITIGLVGVGILVASSGLSVSTSSRLGILALVGADVAWASGTIYTKARLSGRGGFGTAAVQVVSGGVCLLLASLASGEIGSLSSFAIPGRSVVALAYLVVFGSVIAYSAYVYMLEVATPIAVSTTAYVNPALAVVLGWVVLGEVLTLRQAVGAAAILTGVVLMTVPFSAIARRFGSRSAQARHRPSDRDGGKVADREAA
jgi:drug/metabolite transporter (DMT)-like permease